VAATVGAMDQMMQLEPARGTTTGSPAAAAIATPHEARDARWNILMRPLRRTAVDRTDMLSIAHRPIDRRGIDRDLRPGTFLPSPSAALADRDGDLKFGPPGQLGRARIVEGGVTQRGDERIAGKVLAVLVIEHHARLPQERERLGTELESDHTRPRFGIRWIVGTIAWTMICDELFDLPQVLAVRLELALRISVLIQKNI
jgi:hypothetical protein